MKLFSLTILFFVVSLVFTSNYQKDLDDLIYDMSDILEPYFNYQDSISSESGILPGLYQ